MRDESKPLLMKKVYYGTTISLTGPDLKTPLQVERPIYQIEELNKESMYEKPSSTFKEKCAKAFRNVTPLSFLYQTVPLLKWLPEYYWRKDIVGDIISGITVAIMHIPQGMAYGLLGGVPPIVGIYMAFFPVLAYFIFGTSRHVSIGTFAIVCLMTGKVVNTHATVEILQNGTLHTIQENLEGKPTYTNVEVALTVTFTVALIELIMYVLRLGVVSTLLSRTLVNGFTCASAFHVASSQLKDLLGLALKKRSGHFSFPLTVYDAFKEIPNANLAAVKVSAISIILLFLNNEFFKPWLAKKTKIPFPVELIAVVVGTLVSTFLHLEVDYNVTTIGNIPTGLPNPMLPRFALMPEILLDSFLIAMVSYTITMAMALIFARKLTYDVDSNQELLALGVSNTVGSFFGCLPVAASLSRSVIQQTVGGVSQIASVVSAGLLLIVLLWVGPLFESLPRCVLASIIVVALKSLLSEVTSFIHYWKLSKWDGIVWIVTFLTTLIFQISVGLIVGIAVSCLSIFIQGYRPYTCLLGLVPNTDLYLDVKRYKAAQEINGLKIFHYSGGLSFASGASFKQLFVRKVGVDAQAILQKRIKMKRKGLTHDSEEEEQLTIKCVILDFSSLTFVDPSGVDFLRTLQNDLNSLGIALYIVGCSGPVFEVIQKCDKTEKKESKFIIFPTVHDAVLFAQANLFNKNE